MKKFFKENIENIITRIVYVSIRIGLIFVVESYLMPKEDDSHVLGLLIVQYMLGYDAIRQFSRIFDNWKYYKIMYNIVEFPRMMWSIILKPYIKMFLAFVMFAAIVFGGIYAGLKYIPELTFEYDMKYTTKAFLAITFSTIISRAFGNQILKFVGKLNYKYDNVKEHQELSLSIVNEDRFRYLIYILFFIALLYFTVIEFEQLFEFQNKNLTPAILSSFATFIAFDRLYQNWSIVDFNPNKHWKLLIEVYKKDPKYTNEDNYFVGKEKKG